MKQESKRQKKFSKLIQGELSEIFHHEITPPSGIMTTVTLVRTSPDLRICKVYLSAFPDEKSEELLAFVEDHQYDIRKVLAGRIRQQVRYIPELTFMEDDTMEYAEKMDKLINQALHSDEETEDQA